jgi:Domain of unknown function (DUF397)
MEDGTVTPTARRTGKLVVRRGALVSERKLSWIKARASVGNNACVELAEHDGMIVLRNSRDPDILLTFTRDEMRAFVRGVAAGEFDRLLD